MGDCWDKVLENLPFSPLQSIQGLPFIPNAGTSLGLGGDFVVDSTTQGTVDFSHKALDLNISFPEHSLGFNISNLDIALPPGEIAMPSVTDYELFSFGVTPLLQPPALEDATLCNFLPVGEDSRIGSVSTANRSPSEADSSSSSSNNNSPTIDCSWPSCMRSFSSRRDYNQHCRCHTKPFVCDEALCTKRFGTKTHLQRHKNVNHRTTTRFFCKSMGCPRSRSGGRHFTRMDYCKNHVRKKHQMGGEGVDIVTIGEARDIEGDILKGS